MLNDRNYVEQVAAQARSRRVGMLPALALLLLFISYLFSRGALEPIPPASVAYQTVLRAARISLAGWALFFAMLGVSMLAKTARAVFSLPVAKRLGAEWFVTLRNVGIGLLLFILLLSSCEPMGNQGGYADDRLQVVLCCGLVWLVFSIDLVPLLFRASRSLKARLSALRFKPSSVGGTETGAVRVEGRIASSGQKLGSGHSELIYRHSTDEEQSEIELVPFLLENDGHRLFVDVVPEKTLVISDQDVLGVGDEVEVWGNVSRPKQAYRGDAARMTAGAHRLVIVQGNRKVNRRFVLAASVELVASAGFVAIGMIFGLYLLLSPAMQ